MLLNDINLNFEGEDLMTMLKFIVFLLDAILDYLNKQNRPYSASKNI